MRDVENLWKAGLALGASLDNAIALADDRIMNAEGLRPPAGVRAPQGAGRGRRSGSGRRPDARRHTAPCAASIA